MGDFVREVMSGGILSWIPQTHVYSALHTRAHANVVVA